MQIFLISTAHGNYRRLKLKTIRILVHPNVYRIHKLYAQCPIRTHIYIHGRHIAQFTVVNCGYYYCIKQLT